MMAKRKVGDRGTSEARQSEGAAQEGAADDRHDVVPRDHDTSNSGDSSDDSGDIDVDAETAQRLMHLETELRTTPSYETYLEYIALLRATPGLRTRLREAHEALSERYPLSEELWLGWVNDELAGVGGPEDLVEVLALLRRAATRDYLAPGVWELYLDVAHDLDSAVRDLEPEGVERYRALCEEALAAAGLHLAAGHQLWEKYRKFELEVEAKVAGKGGAAATKQEDRVRALYQRQLQVPLLDVAQTLEEYKAWEAGHGKSVPAHVIKAADKAREAAEVRAGCEAGVSPEAPADVVKLGAFLSYIKMEQNAGDPARVQVVYERAVAAFPLTHSLWLQYGQYMETHTKLPGPINDVYGRAVRNCPWVGTVWERAIRALDRSGLAPEAVDGMYEKALQAGLQTAEDYMMVILARIDYLRRAAVAAASSGSGKKAAFTKLRGAFQSATELMMSHFPDYLDRTLRLPAYWAHCEVHVMLDMAAAREVWEGAIKGGIGRYVEAWQAFIGMETAARNIKEARALYKRCFNRRLEEDGQLRLCHAWLRFEREEGSADDYLQSLLKVEPILEDTAAAAVAAADQAAAAAAKAALQKATQLSKEEVKALRQAKDPNFQKTKKNKSEKGGKSGKRGRQEGNEHAPATSGGADESAFLTASKRVRTQEPQPAAAEAVGAGGGTPDAGPAEGLQAAEAAAPGDADAEMEDHDKGAAAGDAGDGHQEDQQAGPGPGTKGKGERRPHYTDKMTVFIKGLRPEVKDGELDAFLKEHVPEGIKEVRLMRDQATGQARGFAYVECSSREALDKAVELNGSSFQGNSLFIAESKPPGHSAGGWAPAGRGGRFTGRGGRGPPGARGGFAGRGHFGGGRGRGRDSGSGGDADGDTDMTDAGDAGGGGGRGGRGRGGERHHPGLGHPTGRGNMRTHLHLAQSNKPPTALVPWAVQLAAAQGGAATGEHGNAGASSGQPLSNDDFRRLLLGGKK